MTHEIPERFLDWLDDEEVASLTELANESGATIAITEIAE